MLGFNDLSTPLKAIIALAFVLVLVVIAGLLLRRITGGRLKLPGQGARARQPRLGVVDIFELDRHRQLVLLRRDNVEHLVMIGGPNDVVIEPSIVRGQTRAAIQAPAPSEAAERAAITAPAATAPPRVARPETARIEPAAAARADAKRVEDSMAAGAGAVAGAGVAAAVTSLAVHGSDRPAAASAAGRDLASDAALAGPMEAPVSSTPPAEPAIDAHRLPGFLRQDVRPGGTIHPPDQAGAKGKGVSPAPQLPADDRTTKAPAPEAAPASARAAAADKPAPSLADRLAVELEALVAQPLPAREEPAPKASSARSTPSPQPSPQPAAAPARKTETASAPASDRSADIQSRQAAPQSDGSNMADELARELNRMLATDAPAAAGAGPRPQPGPVGPVDVSATPPASPDDRPQPRKDRVDTQTTPARVTPRQTVSDATEPKPAETTQKARKAGGPPAAALTSGPKTEPAPPASVATGDAQAVKPASEDPFSIDAIEAEFARLLNRPVGR